MKKIVSVALAFFSFIKIHAQEKISYHTSVGNIEFAISAKEIYTEFSLQDAKKVEEFAKNKFEKFNSTSATIELESFAGEFAERKQQLKNQLPYLVKIEPVLVYTDGVKQIATGEINMKVKDGYNISEIMKGYNFEVEPSSITSNFFIVSNKNISTEELFSIVDKLQQDKRVAFAEPNFIRELKPCTNDSFFTSQWAIKNQGYWGGTMGADMKVEPAWDIATGNGIKVAIIDEGVDLTHPDLQANLLTGFDATGNSSNGAPSGNDAHGTACAGIVAAIANNTIGIAGVAHNCRVIPVRIAYSNGFPFGDARRKWITADTWIANGINWSWQNGADVLSNSWGGGSYSSTIATAVTNAVTNGRSGKGCVVLFASGNANGAVSFPATLANVIAVGASSMCDERKSPISCDGELWGGNYGSGLDVMAPGVNIYTTDIHGSAGYNSGDYRANFNGTSSACPNAAGVIALVLSANPNLTGQQARDILETTCDKVGGYTYASSVAGQPNGTWSNDAGYGRINAATALCKALVNNLSISGNSSLCTTATYTVNAPSGSTVSWSASPAGIVTLTPSGSSMIVTKAADGVVTIKANVTSACTGFVSSVTKQINVGTPQAPSMSTFINFCLGGTDWELGLSASTTNPTVNQYIWSKDGASGTATMSSTYYTYEFPPSCMKIGVRAGNACGFGAENSQTYCPPCSSLGMIVSPNPTKEQINVALTNAFTGKSDEDVIFKIYELNSTILVRQWRLKNNQKVYSLNLAGIHKGNFILEVTNGHQKENRHILIQE